MDGIRRPAPRIVAAERGASDAPLPVRVETVLAPLPGVPGERLTLHDFEFNKDLAVSLFSTQPPAGYEVEERTAR